MTRTEKDSGIRVRSCCACESTIVTALELAKRKMPYVPRGMKLFWGLYLGQPFCNDCLPAKGKVPR